MATAGYSGISKEYESHGWVTREAYFDEEDQAMIVTAKKYASVTKEYNKQAK